jgi:threonine aldolase
LRQRAGQGFSKNWFIAAQLAAYLEKDHWLDLARHSNAMAARLVAAVRGSKRARLAFEPDGNEVFVILETRVDQRLRAAGVQYYPWTPESLPVAERPGPGEALVRMLTSWQTTTAEIDRVGELLD